MVLHLKIVSLLGIKQTETMKILNSDNYINEKLTIQPVTKDRLSDYKKPSVDGKARKFIEDNNLIWNPLSKSYDCEGNVYVSEDIVIDGKLKIRFGKVVGDFNCSDSQLTTLEGTPKEVGRNFYCRRNKLTTLEGAPKEVSGSFYCSRNNLTTLKNAPQKVGGDFDCIGNKLTTLEGAPQEVGGYFSCSNNELTTLEGAPQEIGKDFDCSFNNLTTLKGTPQKVGGYFNCSDTNLATLEYAPKEVDGNFLCRYNPSLVLPEDKPSWLKWRIIS